MKAILEFNLPEDQDEFEITQNGYKYNSVLRELDNWLRSEIKYGERKDETTLQEVRDKLYQLVQDEELRLF